MAPATAAKPNLTATPSGTWVDIGDTDGGVTVTHTQDVATFVTDQAIGKKKAIRMESGIMVETSLAEATLENMAMILSQTVTDTPPTTAVIGTRSIKLYRGPDVSIRSLLFRGTSPYGNWPAQLYIPYGYIDGETGMPFTKDGKTLIPFTFQALEDPAAATEADRFGIWEAQDATTT
jgi:hypothetical protein